MKKLCVVTLVLMMWFTLPCSATTDLDAVYEEQLESSGANDLFNALPDQTKEWLYTLGITDLNENAVDSLTLDTALQGIWDLFVDTAKTPMAAGAVMIGAILLCALIEGAKETVGTKSPLFGMVGVLACSSAVIAPLVACLERVTEAAQSTGVFVSSFVPVYAGILATSGQWASAATFQTVLLAASDGMVYALSTWILPLSVTAFVLGLVGSMTDGRLQLHRIGAFLQKNTAWVLGGLMTLFIGFLSLQNLTAAASDTLTDRMVKFSVSSFVPVVGGSLSEAVGTVKGCLGLLKGTVGAFGVLADVMIVLPPFLECVWWRIWLGIADMTADMFGISAVGSVLKVGGSLIKTMMAVLGCLALLTVLSITVVSRAGGG